MYIRSEIYHMESIKNLSRTFIILFLISLSGNAYSSTKSVFSEGTTAFKSKNYLAAIKHFKNAEKMGLETASLYFNLGSSYFKAKQYKQAEIYFKKLKKHPKMMPIASYNLGLVNLKLGKKKPAIKWFRWVISDTQDRKLITLSKNQLKKLNVKVKVKTKSKDWSVYTSVAWKSDSNVDVAPSGTPQEQSDTSITLFLNSEFLLAGKKSNGWFAGAGFYDINYSKFNSNEESQYNISLKRKLKISDWKTRFTVTAAKSTFDGQDYQSILMLEAISSKKLSKKNRLRFRFRHSNISSENTLYDYLEGNKQQLRVEFRRKSKANSQRYYYELETNDREDSTTLSYSPTRHNLKAIYTSNINKKIQWGGEFAYRQSDYPIVLTTDRDSTRWKFGFFGVYRFDKTTKLKARAIHTDNDANDDTYDYEKDVISLTLSKLF